MYQDPVLWTLFEIFFFSPIRGTSSKTTHYYMTSSVSGQDEPNLAL